MTDEIYQLRDPLHRNRRALLRISLIVEGGMLVLALLLAVLLGVPFWASAQLSLSSILTGIVAGMVMLVAAAAITESNFPFAIQMRRDMDRLAGLFRGAKPADFLFISLLAGTGEEAFFRGLLQTGLEAHLGLPAAVAVSALAFGLVHFISRSYVAFAGVLGVLFSGLYVWSDNIAVPMLAHATYDFIALCYVRHEASTARKE